MAGILCICENNEGLKKNKITQHERKIFISECKQKDHIKQTYKQLSTQLYCHHLPDKILKK